MSDYVFHIGQTKLAVVSVFGSLSLAVCQPGGDYERVASFVSEVAASRFVDTLKQGMAQEGIDVMSWRPKPPEQTGN